MQNLDSKKTWPIFIVFAVLILGVVGYFCYKYYTEKQNEPITLPATSVSESLSAEPTPISESKPGAVVYSVKRNYDQKIHEIKGYYYNAKTGKTEEIASWSFSGFDFHSMVYESAYALNPIQTSPNLDFAVYARTKQMSGMDAGEGPTQLVKYDFKTKEEDIILSLDNENYFMQWLLSEDGEYIIYKMNSNGYVNKPTNEVDYDLYKINISTKEKQIIAGKIGKYTQHSEMALYPDDKTVSWAYYEVENSDYFRYSININTKKTELTPWYNYKIPDYTSTFPTMLTISMISPDRQKVVFDEYQADGIWKIKMVKIANKEFSDIFQTQSNYAPRAETRWSPDNIHVAWDFTPFGQGDMSNYPGQLWLINTNEKKGEKIAEHKNIFLHDWSKDGKYIYFVARDDKILSLYQYDMTKKQTNKLIDIGESDAVLDIIK